MFATSRCNGIRETTRHNRHNGLLPVPTCYGLVTGSWCNAFWPLAHADKSNISLYHTPDICHANTNYQPFVLWVVWGIFGVAWTCVITMQSRLSRFSAASCVDRNLYKNMALRLPSATVQRLRRSQATYLDIGTEQDREYIELLVNLMTMHSYFIAPVRLLIIAAGKIYFWKKFF